LKDIDSNISEQLQNEIANAILNVESAKRINEIHNISKLKGYKNAFRIRIGNYRIGVFITNNIVEFARFVHRKDIYRLFP